MNCVEIKIRPDNHEIWAEQAEVLRKTSIGDTIIVDGTPATKKHHDEHTASFSLLNKVEAFFKMGFDYKPNFNSVTYYIPADYIKSLTPTPEGKTRIGLANGDYIYALESVSCILADTFGRGYDEGYYDS